MEHRATLPLIFTSWHFRELSTAILVNSVYIHLHRAILCYGNDTRAALGLRHPRLHIFSLLSEYNSPLLLFFTYDRLTRISHAYIIELVLTFALQAVEDREHG